MCAHADYRQIAILFPFISEKIILYTFFLFVHIYCVIMLLPVIGALVGVFGLAYCMKLPKPFLLSFMASLVVLMVSSPCSISGSTENVFKQPAALSSSMAPLSPQNVITSLPDF
jgi:hypothetical protein